MANWLRRLMGRPERCGRCGRAGEIAANVQAEARVRSTGKVLAKSRKVDVCEDCLATMLLLNAADADEMRVEYA